MGNSFLVVRLSTRCDPSGYVRLPDVVQPCPLFVIPQRVAITTSLEKQVCVFATELQQRFGIIGD